MDDIDPREQARHPQSVGGQAALKPKDGRREPDPNQRVEQFGSPLIVMDAPSSINWATPASTALFAGRSLHWSAASDVHIAAGHTGASVSANASSLCALSCGLQAVAASGPVSLQAHTAPLELLADMEVTIISVNDSIDIRARRKITLRAGQSSITLEGGNITFACPGTFTVKGSQHPFEGGTRHAPDIGSLPGAE
jgi:type VI secretion system secreted protein VgrG